MEFLETPRPARITGEWLGDDHPGYRGELLGWWNGWAVWRCTFEVACDVVEDQQAMIDNLTPEGDRAEYETLAWDVDEDEQAGPGPGDVLLTLPRADYAEVFPGDPVPEPERTTPDKDGQYRFGGDWCWEAELDEPLTPTTDEQRRTFQRLKRELAAATSSADNERGGLLLHTTHHDDDSDTFRPAFCDNPPYQSVRVAPDGTYRKETVSND